MVAIGPFSVFAATGRSTSPFNIEWVPSKPFSNTEVKALFNDFALARQCNIDPQVVDDICERTNG